MSEAQSSVSHDKCHNLRKACEGPKWKDHNFWKGSIMIKVVLAVVVALGIIGAMAVSNGVSQAASETQALQDRIRVEKRLDRIELKLDEQTQLIIKMTASLGPGHTMENLP